MFVTICDFLENSQRLFGTLTNSNELLESLRNLIDLQDYDFRIRKCKILHVTTIRNVIDTIKKSINYHQLLTCKRTPKNSLVWNSGELY